VADGLGLGVFVGSMVSSMDDRAGVDAAKAA